MRELSAIVCLSLVLAGCAGSGDDSQPLAGEGTTAGGQGQVQNISGGGSGGSGGSGGGSGGSGGDGSNSPPSGTLKASLKQVVAPGRVNFTLDGSDVDGDPLSWSLDVNMDGKPEAEAPAPATFPAEVNHTFTNAGLFNVTYTLSDGNVNVLYFVVVNVTLPAGGPVAGAVQSPITFSDTITGAYMGAPVVGGVGYTGSNDHTLEVSGGQSRLLIHIEWDSPGCVDLDYFLYDPAGTEVAVAAAYNEPTGTVFAAGEPDLDISWPESGTWTLTVAPGEALECAYSGTASFQ